MEMALLLGIAGAVFAQVPDPGLATERRHLGILGGWAGANLVGGTAGAVLARTPQGRSFHATNAAWNTVNAGLAVVGLAGMRNRRDGEDSIAALRKRHRALRTTLAVNLGLDVVYVATGAALWGTGGELKGADLRSVGQALALQGGFLLVFDAAFLASHHHRAPAVTLGPGSVHIRF